MSETRIGRRSAPAEPARGAGPPSSGGGGRWVWLMTAHDAIEAELVRGVLDQSSIPVALDRRDPTPQAWMFLAGNMHAPVRIMVPATLLDSARLAIMESGFDESAPDPSEPARAPARPRFWLPITIVTGIIIVWFVVLHAVGVGTCAFRIGC